MSEEKVKLGLMPPLTGVVGIYGSEIVHAAQIACQEINENGGVLGRPLELVIEDDGSLPESSVVAAKKLVEQHHCTAIIGNLLSNSRISVAYSVAEPRKIPLLNFSFYEGSILSRYFFHFAALPNQQIDKMIPYMANKFGSRVFFAGNNYEWPRGSIHAGKLVLENVGGEVVGEEYLPIGVDIKDIDELLDHIEAAAPDVFVPYFAGIDQINLLTRFTERGLKKRMAVVMGHYDEMMASQLSPEVREGFYSSNTYFMTVDSAENRNYLERLANLPDVNGIWPKGNGILTNFGEGTYVCVIAFAAAANKAGSLDAEVLVETLKTINISAPQGTIQMNPEHHHARVNTYLSQCNAEGVFKIVENFGGVEPQLPKRYKHQRIVREATIEDDIRLQARMLDQMSEAVHLVKTQDKDSSIIYTNAGAEKMFGYGNGEMIGMSVAMLNDPNDIDPKETAKEIIRILHQKGEWQGEIRNIKKDGTSFWCSATVTTFTHPVYGEVWLSVHRDITERKNAENALLESESLLEKAQELAQIGHWKLITSTNEVEGSVELFKIFGLSREEACLDKFVEVVHPDDREMDIAAIQRGAEFGESWDIEHRLISGDGIEKWVHAIGEAFTDETGKVVELLGTVQNISELKYAEIALRENEKRLREAQHVAHLGYLDWNPVTNDITWSEETYSIYGFPLDYKPTLESTIALIHKDDAERVSEALNAAIQNKEDYNIEHRMIRPDGKEIYVHAKGELTVNEQGEVTRMLGTVIDITESKKIEAELAKYREDLEELVEERTLDLKDAQDELVRKERLATLGQLTATVSHELRNPLGAMRPSLYVIQKKSDQNDERVQKAITRIDRNIDRCDRIIDELLDFTRITELNLQATRIDEWLELVIEDQNIPEGISLEKNFSLKDFKLAVDTDRLRRAVINVFENACHAMMDDKQQLVTNKKSHLTIKTTTNNEHIEIILTDTGSGISEDILDKIFEPLFSTKGFGVGLGMPTVKQIMQQHGGGIEIESEEDKGTTVTLWLPMNASEEKG